MRIEGSAYVVDISRSQAIRKENSQAEGAQGARPPARVITFDRVELSPKAKEMQKLKGDLEQLPEVRMDRVALARQKLQDGSLRVEGATLAQRMLDAYKTR